MGPWASPTYVIRQTLHIKEVNNGTSEASDGTVDWSVMCANRQSQAVWFSESWDGTSV